MPDGNTILSVAKAMELLTVLSKAGQPLTLKELSERCGFPKSTVFGLLTTMREYDVISQTPDGEYTLGLRLFDFGCQVEQSWDISSVARPYMEHLAQRTGASVVLSICESGSVITLDQVQPRSNLHVVSNVGARLPIYCILAGQGLPRAYEGSGRAEASAAADVCLLYAAHHHGHPDASAEAFRMPGSRLRD